MIGIIPHLENAKLSGRDERLLPKRKGLFFAETRRVRPSLAASICARSAGFLPGAP